MSIPYFDTIRASAQTSTKLSNNESANSLESWRLCLFGNKKPARRSGPVLAKHRFNPSKLRLALPPESLNGECRRNRAQAAKVLL
jgi:hypothetical protein